MAKHTDAVVTGAKTKSARGSRSGSMCRYRCWVSFSIPERRSTNCASGPVEKFSWRRWSRTETRCAVRRAGIRRVGGLGEAGAPRAARAG